MRHSKSQRSGKAGCPTQRATDWWDSARFMSIVYARRESCSRSFVSSRHQRLTPAVGQLIFRISSHTSKGVAKK